MKLQVLWLLALLNWPTSMLGQPTTDSLNRELSTLFLNLPLQEGGSLLRNQFQSRTTYAGNDTVGVISYHLPFQVHPQVAYPFKQGDIRLIDERTHYILEISFLLKKPSDVERLYADLLETFKPYAQQVKKEDWIQKGEGPYLTELYFNKDQEYPALHLIGGKGSGFTRVVVSYVNEKLE